ncbi:MAG: hypothetical protein ACRDF7_11190, partial [Candidatus Limnocylindrales bacterium]
QPIAGEATAKAAAAGWGGDRVAMFEGPGGAWLIAWSTAWDTPADATEFTTAATAATAADVGRVVAVAGSRQVTVLLASGPDILDRIHATP